MSANKSRTLGHAPRSLAEKLEEIQNKSGLRMHDIAQLLDTNTETVSQWQKGNSQPRQRLLERLLVLTWLVTHLASLYEPRETRKWLYASHPLLEGETPASRIQKDRADDVLALIDQLMSGAFV